MKTVCALLLLAAGPLLAQPPARPPLAFTHVTVIDGTGAPPQGDMVVVVTGDRITALGPSGKLRPPADALIVAATGKFLIPGLWDMHVHTALTPDGPDYSFPLLIANGVTGVREMSGPRERLQPYLQEVAEGKRWGPRMSVAGAVLDGKTPAWPGAIPIADANQAERVVADLRNEGAEFVTIYALLPREAYFAVAMAAYLKKLPFAGHVPASVTVEEAAAAGQRSIDHLYRLRHLDSERDATFHSLALNGTWVVPTNIADTASVDGSPRDPRLKYLPAAIGRQWDPREDMRSAAESGAKTALARQEKQQDLELVGALHRAGVALLAGTDTASSNPYTFPGFSLHDQLALLVQAGLTPMEALKAATFEAARYLGREKEIGTIETDRLADLVLLDANPLVDIRNTRKINAVVVGGRLLDRGALDKLLADAAALAAER
jgi:imidazolonepropionase-like amidohydrolase